MLKSVSSVANAIGALNYKGTWNASTNTPTLASGVGTKGDYYVVSVAGSTSLDGISNWGIGDWAVFNGTTWQRVEGGADLNGVNLSVSGSSSLSGPVTIANAVPLNWKNSSGTTRNVLQLYSDNNVYLDSEDGDQILRVGGYEKLRLSSSAVTVTGANIAIGTAGQGIDFSINPSAPGMTSELLNDYEEGTWTPAVAFGGASVGVTYAARQGRYTKVGRAVTVSFYILLSSKGSSAGNLSVTGLPFSDGSATSACCMFLFSGFVATYSVGVGDSGNSTSITSIRTAGAGSLTNTSLNNDAFFWGTYTYQV